MNYFERRRTRKARGVGGGEYDQPFKPLPPAPPTKGGAFSAFVTNQDVIPKPLDNLLK